MFRSIFPDCDAIARIAICIQSLQNLQAIGLKGLIVLGNICRCDNAAGVYRRKLEIVNEESHLFTGQVVGFDEGTGRARLGVWFVTDTSHGAVQAMTRLSVDPVA